AHVDCSSTLDMISANFAAAAKLDTFQLKEPVKLQMATSGSKSTINFGAWAEIQIGHFSQKRYFDIVNLDRYEAIFRIPFLRENEILLSFQGTGSFRLAGRWFPLGSREPKQISYKEGEGAASSSKERKRKWLNNIKDLFIPESPELPPLRIVNHEIPLINPNLKLFHRPPKCPEPLREQLRIKVERYLKAGWWERTELPSSAPLMIVLK
ncbi:hypothetical protein M378DRAFT_39106, partial [Amanita muscaria Koide BX008]